MTYAPIALFIFNRPDHTRQTIESLKKCPEYGDSPLYIFCDGPRSSAEQLIVRQARNAARYLVENKAIFVESDVNKGLANSIIEGVGYLCGKYGRVIVVEDDLIVSQAFLTYLNAALEKYADYEKVMQISAHMFPVQKFSTKLDAFFLPFTTSWGWATWQRSWKQFDSEVIDWQSLKTDPQVRKRFNLDGTYDYYSMLKNQMAGKIDSWAIRWYWFVFKCDGVVLFPPRSYVNNIGFDGSGTHGWRLTRLIWGKTKQPENQLVTLVDSICVCIDDYKAVKNVLRRMNYMCILLRIWNKLSRRVL